MQADKEIRKEKEIKRKFQTGFFFPFPPLLSNISVISPQTRLWMHFHVPHTNQTAEISKLPSQAPNKGFKMRTGYGTAQLNLPLLQLHDPPPPHPGDAYVLLWPCRMRLDAQGKSSWWTSGHQDLGQLPHSLLRCHVDTLWRALWKTHARPVRALRAPVGLTDLDQHHQQPHFSPALWHQSLPELCRKSPAFLTVLWSCLLDGLQRNVSPGWTLGYAW